MAFKRKRLQHPSKRKMGVIAWIQCDGRSCVRYWTCSPIPQRFTLFIEPIQYLFYAVLLICPLHHLPQFLNHIYIMLMTLMFNAPLILSIPSVTWKSTMDPSKKKRSHIRKSIFMWTTDANNVRNQCRVMRLSSISCSLSVTSTSGRYLQIIVLRTRWSACIPTTRRN
jgi:hypothetical protein